MISIKLNFFFSHITTPKVYCVVNLNKKNRVFHIMGTLKLVGKLCFIEYIISGIYRLEPSSKPNLFKQKIIRIRSNTKNIL